MSDYPLWPVEALHPERITRDIAGASIADRSIAGASTAMEFSGGGLVTVQYHRVKFQSPAQHRAWGRMAAQLRGSIRPVRLPILSWWTRPVALGADGYPRAGTTVGHEPTGAGFAGGGGYAAGGVGVTVDADAALNAGTMRLRLDYGAPIEGGEWFGIIHPVRRDRVYQIRSIDSVEGIGPGAVYTVAIDPPLREAVPAGTWAEFDDPTCLMRLPPGQTMADDLDEGCIGGGSPQFEEWF